MAPGLGPGPQNGDPPSCAAYLERRPPGCPLLADDGQLTAFLTGREPQDRFALLALDQNLRLLSYLEPADPDVLLQELQALYDASLPPVIRQPAPVLVLPRVFDDALCGELVDMFEADGDHESGVLSWKEGVSAGPRTRNQRPA